MIDYKQKKVYNVIIGSVFNVAKNIRNKLKKIFKKELFSGFTLIEMIGVIIVLSVIALVVYPTIGRIIANNKT